MNPDGSEARQVTTSPGDKTRVTWFPDGQELLVSTQAGKIFRVDLDSGREEKIPLEVLDVRDAALSPDGTRIAFSATTHGSRDGHDIWIAQADGSHAVSVAAMPNLQYAPAWSPDGEWIYFHSGPVGANNDIWRVRADGTKKEQVVFNKLFAFDAAVSPAGVLAFSSNTSGNYEIWVETQQGKFQPCTDNPALDGSPTWSPTGDQLIFESNRGGNLNLWRVRCLEKGSPPVQLTSRKQGARAPSWWHPGGVGR